MPVRATLLPACFTAALMALLHGCTTPATPPSDATSPGSLSSAHGNAAAWWNETPPDTPQDLFALGFGSNPQQARRDAVNQAAAKLSTAVSSSFEQTVSEQTGSSPSLQSSTRLRTRQVVGQLNLNQHEVVRRDRDGDTHVALIKVNKPLLLRDAQTRFADLQQRIQDNLQMPTASNDLYQSLRSLGHLSSQGQSLQRLAFLLISLGRDPATVQSGLSLARSADSRYRNFLKDQLFIISASPDSRELADLLRSALARRGADVRLNVRPIPQDALVLRLRGFSRINPAPNGFSASLTRQLSLHRDSSTYFSDEWSASGVGPSRSAAVETARDRLLDQWIQTDSLPFLGW